MSRSVSPTADVRAVLSIRRYIRANEIEIVHCHSAKAGMLGRFAAVLTSTDAVYTLNSSPFRLSMAYRLIETLTARFLTTFVIAVSESERAELVTNGIVKESKIRVVPSGIGALDTQQGRPPWPTEFGCDVVVGTVGRVAAQKKPAVPS